MMLMDLPRLFVLPFLFIIGCCIGSFLNVCIHRFPSKERLRDQLKALNSHSSGCPKCSAAILWRDNIPLLGWLMLRGRCRKCRQTISARYPLVELLTGILFIAVYQLEMPRELWPPVEDFGIYSADGPQNIKSLLDVPAWLHLRYALHIGMICCLIVATFIDLELKIIPDGCTIPMMVAAVIAHTASGQLFLVPLWFQEDSVVNILRTVAPDWLRGMVFSWDCLAFAIKHPHLHGFLVSMAGIAGGAFVVWIVRVTGTYVLKQEAMGQGDVILMAMVGSVIGWQPVIAAFFLAPILAIFAAIYAWLRRGGRELPYGPWLSLATLFLLMFWGALWPLAERIYDMGPFLPVMAGFMVLSLIASLYLVQFGKRLLGLQIGPDIMPEDGGWTSADHLHYYNSERTDQQVGQWPTSSWPGVRSGQGLSNYHQWRNGR
jgi:leader peptidase (prepilin peptidase) / N-methyltransferase